MGERTLFQVCYEGDLTVEVSDALRRLRAKPNFDQSWQVMLEEPRAAAVLVRYLRMLIGGDAKLLVAPMQWSRRRDLLLVRHSTTPGADYRELHGALERLGWVLELPFESTFLIDSDDHTDVRTLGEALAQLSPDESIMVVGVGDDFAWCTAGSAALATNGAAAAVSRSRTFQ
ncbi:MAG: hypothetical protein ABR517_00710 [Thermoanaerobaculia bacterium]